MSADTSTIDAILRGLTNRPNVDSTLILARQTGSIIQMSGAIAEPRRAQQGEHLVRSGQDITVTGGTPSAGEPSNGKSNNSEDGTDESTTPGAQALARAVFAFVGAASQVGASLATRSETNTGFDQGLRNGPKNSSDAVDKISEDRDNQVQLLRMRTKNQEIIIFPDPKYLCCVVQNIGANLLDSAR